MCPYSKIHAALYFPFITKPDYNTLKSHIADFLMPLYSNAVQPEEKCRKKVKFL
jgi:hypothetical protein